jgi:hypothetical protein
MKLYIAASIIGTSTTFVAAQNSDPQKHYLVGLLK